VALQNEWQNPKRFTVADLDARGQLITREIYNYDDLEKFPRAADLIAGFSSALWKKADAFELNPVAQGTHVDCRWRAIAETAGILTLRCVGELASLSLLVSGKDEDADRITLETFQKHLLQELHDTGYEPAFDLLSQTDRPMVATINFGSPKEPADQMTVALADRCFAASYFRFQQLA
jgi:hypothetical protein